MVSSIDAFKRNYLCAGLPEDAVKEISELAEIVDARLNQKIITKGEKSSDLYIIINGTVDILTKAGDKLGQAGPGSVLGEVALVDDHPRSADAICITPVKYARLPAPTLRKYMSNKKEYGFIMLANLARVLSMRLRNSDQVMESLLLHQANREVLERQLEQSRLAATLDRLAGSEVVLRHTAKPTPLAFPLLVDHMREQVSSESLSDRIMRMTLRLEKAAG